MSDIVGIPTIACQCPISHAYGHSRYVPGVGKTIEPRAMTPIGMRIYRRMRERQLNQTGLAKLIGIKPPSLNNLIWGQSNLPNANTLTRLADALWTTERWILYDEGPKERIPSTAPEWVAAIARELADLPEDRAKSVLRGTIEGIKSSIAAEGKHMNRHTTSRALAKVK
ncbi:MAG: helix-turn-helix transcriptional regulator [Burkholderiales bacterium]|nr:helix-turn-helix transcriptional regulator [Burkholderiales bacterium]